MQPLFILSADLGIGGVQRKIVDIVNYLQLRKLRYPVFIISAENKEFNLSAQINNPNVKIIYSSNLFFPFSIFSAILKYKPFAVLSFVDYGSVPAIITKLIFRQKIKIAPCEDHFASKVIPRYKLGHIRNLLIKIFYPYADVIFTCSQANKEDLVKSYGLDNKKIKIIRNWTTVTGKFQLKSSNKKYDLIYAGRFYWTKNLEFLIKALAKVKKRQPNIKLCMLGEGEEEQKLKLLSNKYDLLDNVNFIKPVPNVADYLSRSKILVLSSHIRAEGLPMIILEAMAVGTPVLSRDFAGAEEFLKDKENCYFFKTEEEFVRKAVYLIDNGKVRKEIAQKAREYVKKYHSSRNILDYFRELTI